ncbi:MAG: hypothetical protein H6843_10630 [Rhodospirillaceae bacterium]|nr:hypothetical protein [Rhodospirillaceae bacterium]
MMWKAAVAAGVATVMWTSAASAVSMSMNWLEFGDISTLDECLDEGEHALNRMGLSVLTRTASAAWAEAANADELYTVYCIADSRIIVVVGAGTDLDSVDATVVSILDSFGGTSGKN